MLLLVTRPGDTGQRLVAHLASLGQAALWWPAFDLLPPAEPALLQAAIERLAQYDLVVFVSPMAVRAFAAALGAAAWPEGAGIAGVGAATLRAVAGTLRPAAAVPQYGPRGPGAGDGGAEALWEALEALPVAPRHVLIVRAQAGREWLGDRLRAAGATVDEIEAYRRCPHQHPPGDWARLQVALAGGGPLAVLFSSTEAVGTVTPDLARQPWIDMPQVIALCVHERIEQAARGAGWRDVRRCEPEAPALLAVLAGTPSDPAAARSGAAAG